MQIPPPTLAVTLTGGAPQASSWQTGQLLEALVIRTDPVRPRADVRIGGINVSLDLPVRVPDGSRLTLQVVRAGTPPVLTLVGTSPGTGPATVSPTATGTGNPGLATTTGGTAPAWLSALLPVQGSQTPLLSALQSLAANPQQMQALPPEVRTAVENVLRQMPTMEQAARPDGLRQAVGTSGLFHEASLAIQAATTVGASSMPAANLKSVLLSLAARLRAHPGSQAASAAAPRLPDTPPPGPGQGPRPQARVDLNIAMMGREAMLETLRARTESALARMALHQWSSMESSEPGLPRWLLELPLRSQNGIDLIHLLLERQPRRKPDEEGPTWRAELALDLPGLGPLHVQVAVTGDQVRTRFWAESADTVRHIRAHLPTLKGHFEERALHVRDLGCNAGSPPDPGRSPQRRPLLDDHA